LGPPQAVAAVLERLFDFVEILYLQRQAQALNLIMEALDGNTKSPFVHKDLTVPILRSGIFYLLRSNSMLSAVIRNTKNRNADIVEHYITHVNEKRTQSLKDLVHKGVELYQIPHTYFAVGVVREKSNPKKFTKLKIYCLGYTKLGRPGKPQTAVDYYHHSKEKHKRAMLNSILFGSNFIVIPFLPGVGSAVKLTYRELIVREFHRRQMWENGLLAHIVHNKNELANLFVEKLQLSQEEGNKLEKEAVQILETNRLSPFDLSVEEREVQGIKSELWIKHRQEKLEAEKSIEQSSMRELEKSNLLTTNNLNSSTINFHDQ